MLKPKFAMAAGTCLAARTVLAPMALANPDLPQHRLLAGVGSDTTADVMNLMPKVIPSLAFWDGPGPHSTKDPIPGSNCVLSAPAGSNGGVQQLIAERDAAVAGNRRPCLDFARSSANNSGSFGAGNDLTWVPFAKDGITIVVRKNWSFSTNFSVALLRNLYACTDPRTLGPNPTVKPLLPQPGSGVRSAFLTVIGTLCWAPAWTTTTPRPTLAFRDHYPRTSPTSSPSQACWSRIRSGGTHASRAAPASITPG